MLHFSEEGASTLHSEWGCGVAGAGREGGKGVGGGKGRELLPLPRTCWNCGAWGEARAGAKWDVPSGTYQGHIDGFFLSTHIQTLPPGGSICGRLTHDLPLGWLHCPRGDCIQVNPHTHCRLLSGS